MESGWRVEPENIDLDQWLANHGEPPLAARMPVLGYGSNANPSKVTWLREELGLEGPAVVLRARCEGLSAVWAAGMRARDGQRPATLAAEPGHVEEHSVWFATPEQLRVLDRCEGRGLRYRLVRLHTGRVVLYNGGVIDSVLAYTAGSKKRMPVLFNGRMVRCEDVSQRRALTLGERAAVTDGLDVTEVLALTEAREHRVFKGKIDKSKLSFGEKAILIAVRAAEGDYRDWDAVNEWTDAIAEELVREEIGA